MIRKTLLSALLVSTSIYAVRAAAAETYVIRQNTLPFLKSATRTGNVDAKSAMDVTVWLKPHNQEGLDALAASQYRKGSAEYRKWLTPAAFAARFAPTPDETKSVHDFLTSHNLAVTAADRFGFFVRAHGTVADVQTAFGVEIGTLTFQGKSFRANTADPVIADKAGALIRAVEGLDSSVMSHPLVAQASVLPPQVRARTNAGMAHTDAGFQSVCFGPSTTQTETGNGITGTYTGNAYNFGTTGCGYTPTQIQAAYGLDKLYAQGLDGTGQTIVIVDWCGSPTITADANAFSKKYQLPALTASNFAITNYPAPSTCSAPDPEINIDVEWAHAIAPGAKIVLLVPPTPSFPDINSSLLYAVEEGLGNVVSNSYGSEELFTDPVVLQTQNFILQAAAVTGISMNFSSGDSGDFTFDFPKFNAPSISAPADSPYATAIGGVSLALDASNTIMWQAGWGTNETLLSDAGTVFSPALSEGFVFGAGGGRSSVFAKPSYQSALPGNARKVPDISWLADPFTGGVIAISAAGQSPTITYTVYGGTSLACPMFSALWAIADQAAGKSLGLAAASIYAAPSGTITDIVPVGSPTNVTATFTGGKVASQSAAKLAAPLFRSTTFYSALFNVPLNPGVLEVLTFGTDSGLVTGPGWDNVTGLGVPNAPAFIANYTAAPTP